MASKKKGVIIVFYFQHCSVASTQMLRIAQSTLLLRAPPSHFYPFHISASVELRCEKVRTLISYGQCSRCPPPFPSPSVSLVFEGPNSHESRAVTHTLKASIFYQSFPPINLVHAPLHHPLSFTASRSVSATPYLYSSPRTRPMFPACGAQNLNFTASAVH